MRFRITTAAMVTACAVAGSGLALSTPAASANAHTASAEAHTASSAAAAKCPYPNVCFWQGSKVTGKFKDTGYWQKLGASRNADAVQNTRRDDVAYVRFSNNPTICVAPGEIWDFYDANPTQVYISTKSKC